MYESRATQILKAFDAEQTIWRAYWENHKVEMSTWSQSNFDCTSLVFDELRPQQRQLSLTIHIRLREAPEDTSANTVVNYDLFLSPEEVAAALPRYAQMAVKFADTIMSFHRLHDSMEPAILFYAVENKLFNPIRKMASVAGVPVPEIIAARRQQYWDAIAVRYYCHLKNRQDDLAALVATIEANFGQRGTSIPVYTRHAFKTIYGTGAGCHEETFTPRDNWIDIYPEGNLVLWRSVSPETESE